MPTPALLLLIATLLPLASFGVLVFVGKRMGTPLAGWFGTCSIGGSMVCSLIALLTWYYPGSNSNYLPPGAGTPVKWGYGAEGGPIHLPFKWIPVGTSEVAGDRLNQGSAQDHPGWLDMGIYVDSLTIAMFAMITLVATLIHIFSIGYMREDKRFPRFFTYLSLFCFSMLGLVLGGTLLQLFVFWELVGLCSYLLIGFWYEKKSASNAAIKAFVVNRIGDFGFLIGFGILFFHLGNVSLPQLWALLSGAQTGESVHLANGVAFSGGLLTIMGIGLFCGAIGKSAQFPLHVWLPDAMEGPTPVSALIHAATMVAAGVYLVGRVFPILTPDAKLVIAIIGCTTLTMAALIAVVQSDIKRVLAYSTLSQLGYMILAMGIGSWVGGLFHLITHAFFKALLFLGSGSVIHAAHHEQELPQYGGLWRKIPFTAATFGIAVLAIAGTPFLSGYYSKSLILTHAGAFSIFATEHGGRSGAYWAFFILPSVIAYITAFYMTRCWMLTFWGKPRNQHLYDHAHEAPIMYGPLVLLAVMSVIGGSLLGVRELLESSVVETNSIVQRYGGGTGAGPAGGSGGGAGVNAFAAAWPVESPEQIAKRKGQPPPDPATLTVAERTHDHGLHVEHTYVGWAWLAGIGLGVLLYLRGYAVAHVLMKIPPLRWIHTWLYRKMYFDELYYAVFLGLTMLISRISGWIDRYIIDGLVNLAAWLTKQTAFGAGAHDAFVIDGAVNGVGKLAHDVGAAVRNPSSGRIRLYVTALMLAIAAGLAATIIVVMSK